MRLHGGIAGVSAGALLLGAVALLALAVLVAPPLVFILVVAAPVAALVWLVRRLHPPGPTH